MAQIGHISGICPKCGEALEIPSHLRQFSCLYCGARLSTDELHTSAPTTSAQSQTDGTAAAEVFSSRILNTVTAHRGIEQSLTKNAYVPAIEKYTQDEGYVFEQLSLAIQTQMLTADEAAKLFLDQLDARWEQDAAQSRSKKSKKMWIDSDKFLISIFLIPMILHLELPHMDAFCQSFHRQWTDRYPKNPWHIGNYEDIVKGFQKKFLGLCFITTAVCAESHMPDDCAQLTAFRNFRDGYLRSCPDGPDLIDTYYKIAPAIVLEIDKMSDRERHYRRIREQWLDPCYEDIQSGNLYSCKQRYTDMVSSLAKQYLC